MLEVVNLKDNRQIIKQYVALRNLYRGVLLTREITLRETIKWLRVTDVELYGLVEKGKLLGAVIIYMERNGEVAIFVERSSMGRGYGNKLLKIAERKARERQRPYLWAWVREKNDKAIRVFENNNYKKIKDDIREYAGKRVRGCVYARDIKGVSGKKTGVLLFALTGFGNQVLDALLERSCKVEAVVTRPENSPFPYYQEKNLAEYARSKKIRVYESFDWEEIAGIINDRAPKLLLVATFHKIIPRKIFSLVPYCVNIHPSILPEYRGPTPIAWVLFKKEKNTGITAHFLTEVIDGGDVLVQRRLKISKNDTESTLRRRLANTAAVVVGKLIGDIRSGNISPRRQEEKRATYFPKFKF